MLSWLTAIFSLRPPCMRTERNGRRYSRRAWNTTASTRLRTAGMDGRPAFAKYVHVLLRAPLSPTRSLYQSHPGCAAW